jgi:hypothetical protein
MRSIPTAPAALLTTRAASLHKDFKAQGASSMHKKLPSFLFLFAMTWALDGYALLFTCQNIPLEGTKKLKIDNIYLLKTRMFHGLPDQQEISISNFITSKTTEMTFVRIKGSPDFFKVTTDNDPARLAYLLAWVSNRERDGTCAIELQGYTNGNITREFLQILAIYPQGTLAVGLPNTTDRQGLILLTIDNEI